MNIDSLLELKKQYELEVVKAEAKVEVITDIIAKQEIRCEYEQEDIAEPTEETPTENY